MVKRALGALGRLAATSLLVAASLVVGPPGGRVLAQRDESARARQLFEAGRAHSSAERWVEALEAFRRSRELLERPATVFNIAAVLVRLGRAREALRALDELRAIADPRRDARLLSDADALRATATASLRHVLLELSHEAARVEVDGELLEGAGRERELTLDPGPHAVVVTLEGHRPARLTLEPGEERLRLELVPLPGMLVVTSSVDTAVIAIDGSDVGIGRVEREVVPGTHDVLLRAEGYHDFSRTLEVGPGEHAHVEAALLPLPVDENVLEHPVFWIGVGGGTVAVGLAVALGLLLAPSTEAPYGGTSGVVLVP